MPQPRQYENRAAQQAAYRKRQTAAHSQLLAQKGLPPMPKVPSIPGTARWNAMITQAEQLLSTIADEMQEYYDDRSEVWQEGERALDFVARIEQIVETVDLLQSVG